MVGRQGFEPVAPHRAVPVELEVIEPVRGFQQRWPVAGNGVRELYSIARRHESDALLHGAEYACGPVLSSVAGDAAIRVEELPVRRHLGDGARDAVPERVERVAQAL